MSTEKISVGKKDDVKRAAIEALKNELAKRSPMSDEHDGIPGRHYLLIINAINEANDLRKGWQIREEILRKAANEGMRVALEDKKDRYDNFDGKMEGAATLLVEDKELALDVAKAFVNMRIADMEMLTPSVNLSPHNQQKAESYEKVLRELEELTSMALKPSKRK